MIISVTVSIKEILERGRNFSWIKPSSCPACRGNRLWGHGFVLAYFDAVIECIWLKRYRCPDCGAVHRLKPEGYFRRFRATIPKIRDAIAFRLSTGRWPSGDERRSRLRNWLKALRRKVAARLGQSFTGRLLDGFDRLIAGGVIPVGRPI